MKTLKFNTNISCAGCIATITPHLNAAEEIQKWEVDITKATKPLTVETSLDEKQVVEIIKKAGYKAEPTK